MNEKSWTFIDKTKWPVRGEWTTEPDKVQWTDDATGLACLAVRNRSHWCGYVGVPEGHPFFKKDYNDIDVEVHGGLTFSEMCDPRGHSDTEGRICHIAEPGTPEHLWWLGFDCVHSGDFAPSTTYARHSINGLPQHYEQYRDIGYVAGQCRNLAAQLKAVA